VILSISSPIDCKPGTKMPWPPPASGSVLMYFAPISAATTWRDVPRSKSQGNAKSAQRWHQRELSASEQRRPVPSA
jgi:hypothetical protein